jgi:hypothetical protein
MAPSPVLVCFFSKTDKASVGIISDGRTPEVSSHLFRYCTFKVQYRYMFRDIYPKILRY